MPFQSCQPPTANRQPPHNPPCRSVPKATYPAMVHRCWRDCAFRQQLTPAVVDRIDRVVESVGGPVVRHGEVAECHACVAPSPTQKPCCSGDGGWTASGTCRPCMPYRALCMVEAGR
eukprot:349775-Chlamydomonas_euryale.AAC.2